MNTEKFKDVKGVCNDSFVLSQIDAYLKENAADILEDIVHSISIKHKGGIAIAEIYGSCYAHEDAFEIKVISNDEEIGYCETLHSSYL
jgi:hypothetical protein|nr:MAG TPA: hypothetical protein [Caudoviricetes sp.]